MVSFVLALIFQPVQKADAVMKIVAAKYRAMKSLNCTFVTRQGSKEIYTGTLTFTKGKEMHFTLSDQKEKCEAGEDWNAKGQGSTWVKPASMRGYNDTISDRQPFVLVRLVRDELRYAMSDQWLDKVEVVKKGSATVLRVRSNSDSDLVLTIDPKTYLVLEIKSIEMYHDKGPLTTFVHYGK